MISTAMQRLGEVSREYQVRTDGYEMVAKDAAVAEAGYRTAKAKRMLRAKVEEKASAAFAEVIADADTEVAEACFQYKIAAATVDAAAKKLMQLREQVATGRTAVASEREVDRIHANGSSGAA